MILIFLPALILWPYNNVRETIRKPKTMNCIEISITKSRLYKSEEQFTAVLRSNCVSLPDMTYVIGKLFP